MDTNGKCASDMGSCCEVLGRRMENKRPRGYGRKGSDEDIIHVSSSARSRNTERAALIGCMEHVGGTMHLWMNASGMYADVNARHVSGRMCCLKRSLKDGSAGLILISAVAEEAMNREG